MQLDKLPNNNETTDIFTEAEPNKQVAYSKYANYCKSRRPGKQNTQLKLRFLQELHKQPNWKRRNFIYCNNLTTVKTIWSIHVN